ncbi:MAG: hypothetical protein WBS18_11310 [Candidatus Acidiferrales bacterium]
MKIAGWGMAILMAVPAVAAAAPQEPAATTTAGQQTATSPLVEAARKARGQQKDPAKTPRVWDNDSIPTIPGAINVVGQEPAPGDSSASADNAAGAPGGDQGASGPVDKTTAHRELSDAKDRLQSLQTDLDLLQRTYTLDQESYYSKTDYQNDKAATAKLKDEQGQIDAKRQEIADVQKQIQDLQAQANAASDAKPADTPAPAQPAAPANSDTAGANGNSSANNGGNAPANDAPTSNNGGSVPNN